MGTWADAVAQRLATVPEAKRLAMLELFEERAAIIEFDAKMSLDEAEYMALQFVEEELK